MAVLQLLRRKIRPAWTYHVEGVIWRLVPADLDLLVGESRNIDKKQASFFCLNRKEGKVLWEGATFEEPWWIGIEAIQRDRVLLHGFATPDMPEHQGITALDVLTGRVVWHNQALRFVQAVGDSVFASKDAVEGRAFLELDYRTGELLRTPRVDTMVPDDEGIRADSAATFLPIFPAQMDFDVFASEQSATMVQEYVPKEHVIGPIETIENGRFLCLGFHERSHSRGENETSLSNMLKIVDLNDGELVYSEMLNANVAGIVADSFFSIGGMLYYIKERATLVAVDLDGLRR